MIETVWRIRRTKIMSCTSRSTHSILNSYAFVSIVERAGVVVLSYGRLSVPRLQIVVEGVVAQVRWERYS